MIDSLGNVENPLAATEAEVEAGSLDAEEYSLAATELEQARKAEAEAEVEVKELRERVQSLESKLDAEKEKIATSRSSGFQLARELALTLDEDLDPELLCMENIVQGTRILRPRSDGGPMIIFDASEVEK